MIRSGIFMLFLYFFATQAGAATLELSGPLDQGTAVLLRIIGLSPGAKASGKLNASPFPITPDGLAVIGLDMEAPPGAVTIEVTLANPDGRRETLRKEMTVAKRNYQEERISLPEGKVTPPNKALEQRIQRETESIKAVYRLRDGQVGFQNGFRQPVTGRFSGVFGSRRILNGKPKNPHNGVDIAAPKGTLVQATAAGLVALAGANYVLTGNTLVLHHGHGVVSLYAHLDQMLVAEGDWVTQGQTIGYVGTTGRSTGPHLHWGTLVRGQRVDPLRMPGVENNAPIP